MSKIESILVINANEVIYDLYNAIESNRLNSIRISSILTNSKFSNRDSGTNCTTRSEAEHNARLKAQLNRANSIEQVSRRTNDLDLTDNAAIYVTQILVNQ